RTKRGVGASSPLSLDRPILHCTESPLNEEVAGRLGFGSVSRARSCGSRGSAAHTSKGAAQKCHPEVAPASPRGSALQLRPFQALLEGDAHQLPCLRLTPNGVLSLPLLTRSRSYDQVNGLCSLQRRQAC